ncbi:MAG: S8 family serine peptidase, partial [Planctomycetaceae bacterium]
MMLRRVALLLLCSQTAFGQVAGSGPRNDQPPIGFPVAGLLPKQETQAAAFLREHVGFDGRGVTVAVFDTGVDPGAPGLQHTSDGQPKIVDLIDGTGSGDVRMSAVREPENGHVNALSGRLLKLDSTWKSRDGTFRVGVKPGFSFFPAALLGRCKQARRREFNRQHRELEQQFERKLGAARDRGDQELQQTLVKRLTGLMSAGSRYRDPGPVFDCVTFHNGSAWQAVIDTDEDGDLADEVVMTSFHRGRQYATFPAPAELNFGVNIYDDGRVLSIVTDSGAHGTHVAGIIGGFHPEAPERNGVAPGVQIVSVKIGDPRLGGRETGQALLRAARAVIRHKCDLVNMSFGEPTETPNQGFLIQELTRLVDDFGVLFVASAGNDGPALSTVGAPGGTSSAVLGVGAYVSPLMMSAEYALPVADRELASTWTSRGPTADGDLGVDVMAPGGAVSPVPFWTRNA